MSSLSSDALAANALLAAFPPGDLDAFRPHLRPVELNARSVLYEAGDSVRTAYFPFSGNISLVVALATGEMVEAAMVGNDGVIGAAAALGGPISINRVIVQLGGHGVACDLKEIKRTALRSEAVLGLLVRYEQTIQTHFQQSAVCNAAHHVDARFARWLLRARDLTRSNMLPFTQEFMAEMMCVRRTSVSVVAQRLQDAGVLKYSRGRIEIVNLDALRAAACECYEVIRDRAEALLRGQLAAAASTLERTRGEDA